jgi:hypothetical protein
MSNPVKPPPGISKQEQERLEKNRRQKRKKDLT